ncbi:Hypothetical predicted protein [Mytilus galloprovincialis]|uniref:Uncharacterized protein n=1 Tax=Mytilus galloprovincialis TaxID=29158 RepID=A0A8B6EN08_MYTGA|nr:Hypothetical predicted protein [Mytilus galloprovincialis]
MTCGNGMIYRNRTCNNPSPSDGGKNCQGVDNESSVCNLGDCPVDGHWGLWSSVRCSVTCEKKTMFLGKMSQIVKRCRQKQKNRWRMEESKKIEKEEYHEVKKQR